MAGENTEEKKKGGILKLLMFVGGGILLVGIGLGVGFFLFGGKPADPSVEIEEIIERKMKEAEEAKAAAEAADADPDKKIAPEVENFVTTLSAAAVVFGVVYSAVPPAYCIESSTSSRLAVRLPPFSQLLQPHGPSNPILPSILQLLRHPA